MDRKIVAAFLADIYRDMARETEYGTILEAIRQNVKLLFFASFSDNFSTLDKTADHYQLTKFDYGNSTIFRLPDLSNFDGLITYDTYMPDFFLSMIEDIKKNAPCPAVTLGVLSENSLSVINDQDISLKQLIEHLIDVHHCKDFIHVAGPGDISFCQNRANVFIKTLEEHNIPFSEDKIIYGNLWYSCGESVVNQILDLYKDNSNKILPDAIVCANDYMAIGIMNELSKRGFLIPEEVIVTGYDNVVQSAFHDPSLTTSAQPFEQVGKDGIKILKKIWNKENPPRVTKEPGILKARQSCGCKPKHIYQTDDLRESYATIISNLGQLSRSSSNLIVNISNATSNKEVYDQIEENCCEDTGFKDAVLCLVDGWEERKVFKDNSDFKDTRFEVVCGIYNGQPIKREMLNKGQLLPKEMMDDPNAYYLVPIHHLQYFFGYFIISPDLENMAQSNVKSWFISVSTMLENWRIRRELKYSVDRLQNLYITDMLTGLYNRRGYGIHFEDYYKECAENHSGLAVFLIDMDNMKHINDTYGHDEGDYCLCTIGDAMRAASLNNEICIRSGGDEFVVLGKNYNQEMIVQYMEKLRKAIDETTSSDNKVFNISVSIGCYCKIPEPIKEEDNINSISEKYLRKADSLMYIEKKEHKMIITI
ncbi:MAG: GGDEF domain-containing protein [Eubacterium sp.]|nr:GGDEF domain-containing protein [Eubacterium sp.]